MTTAQAQNPDSSIRRILIIKLRHHGDMLLTTPVVNTLKARYPDAEIDMLIYQETRDMLAANPSIHHLHCIDRTWKKLGVWSHMAHEIRLMKQVMSRHYDLTLNLSDQWRSAIATRLTGASVRLGFDFPKRQGAFWRFCHTQLVSTKNHHALHTVEQNFGPSKLVFWRPWEATGEVIWAGDFGPLPDPDNIDTNTSERYLNAIPVDVVTDAARRLLA
jgi:heptosyltransferase-3